MTGWKNAFPVDLADEGRYSRREFTRFLALVSAGFTAGIGYLLGRKRPLDGAPEADAHAPAALAVCAEADLEPGESRLFTYRDPQDRCVLVRTPQGDWRAYRQVCTHLGCSVRWDGQRLECPCHRGYFDVERGFPVEGPPTRPLSGLRLERREGRIWVVGDLPKPNQAEEFRG